MVSIEVVAKVNQCHPTLVSNLLISISGCCWCCFFSPCTSCCLSSGFFSFFGGSTSYYRLIKPESHRDLLYCSVIIGDPSRALTWDGGFQVCSRFFVSSFLARSTALLPSCRKAIPRPLDSRITKAKTTTPSGGWCCIA